MVTQAAASPNAARSEQVPAPERPGLSPALPASSGPGVALVVAGDPQALAAAGLGAGPAPAPVEPGSCDIIKQYFFGTIDTIKEWASKNPLLGIILIVALVALAVLMFLPSIVSAIIIGAIALTIAGYIVYSLWENRKQILAEYVKKAAAALGAAPDQPPVGPNGAAAAIGAASVIAASVSRSELDAAAGDPAPPANDSTRA